MATKTTKRGAARSRKPAGRAASRSTARKTTPARRAASAKASQARKPGKSAASRSASAGSGRAKGSKPAAARTSNPAKKPEKRTARALAAGSASAEAHKKRPPEKPAATAKTPAAKPALGKPAAAQSKSSRKSGAGKGRKGALGSMAEESAIDAINGATPDKDGYILFKGRRVRVISTKNVKKRRPLTATERAERAREAEIKAEPEKPIKTKLSPKELAHYRDLLQLLRSQKMGDLSAKEAEALQSNGGNLSHMPIHMADIGTDAYDQDFTLGLAESDRKLIREIDEALSRIENKTYGMCLLTGKPIPKSRLNAKPWAKYTIEAARLIESGQVA